MFFFCPASLINWYDEQVLFTKNVSFFQSKKLVSSTSSSSSLNISKIWFFQLSSGLHSIIGT